MLYTMDLLWKDLDKNIIEIDRTYTENGFI